MKALIQFNIVLLFYAFVRCADLAITAAMARGVVRMVCYGLVALLALIALVVALLV